MQTIEKHLHKSATGGGLTEPKMPHLKLLYEHAHQSKLHKYCTLIFNFISYESKRFLSFTFVSLRIYIADWLYIALCLFNLKSN